VLVEMLRQIGPLQVEGEADLITADNVLMYMRTAKDKNHLKVFLLKDGIENVINRMAKPFSSD
jgi:hypothetical protein